MPTPRFNKYRAALHVLQKGRDLLADELAETVLDRSEDLLESAYLMTDLVETQGSRLHYLAMLMAQLEQSADDFDALESPREARIEGATGHDETPAAPPGPGTRRRPRGKKRKRVPGEQASTEGSPHDPDR
jgi:hypothetical protein